MNDDHMNAFVSECHESITGLNNALLALEDDPYDEEAIESVFRTAHTLKGNFGAMGFENASELAHVLEDLLDEIRDGEISVTPSIMDAAFDGVDRIETIVDEIESTGDTDADTESTIKRLQNAIEDGNADRVSIEPTPSKETLGGVESTEESTPEVTFANAELVPTFEDAESVVHGHIGVDPDGMLGVDGMLVLEPLAEAFEAFQTAPSRAEIEEGEYEGQFDIFVCGTNPEELETFLSEVGAVEAFATSDVTAAATDSGDVGADDAAADTSISTDVDTATDEASANNSVESEFDGDAESEVGTEADSDDESDADSDVTNEESQAVEAGSSDSDDGGPSGVSADGSDISSIRIDVDQIDELHGLVEQLVTGRFTIRRAIENGDFETAETSLNDFDKVTSRLQNTVMDMRLIPLRRVVSNLPRVVRDIARNQDKKVDFKMYGEDIELDRSILTEIEDPLIHVLRNAVDHGIEPPAEREAAGKPREGNIELRASRHRDYVTIEVEDDGGGIDPDAVRAKAVDEGVISESEAETLPDDDAYDLVFHPGFSTASEVTDVSGRGVGMDIVHSTVEQLDGSVNVDSELGAGTTVTVRLPVSVAIVNVLFVRVGNQEYGIPIKNIDELTPAADMEMVNGSEVVRHEDDLYPVVRLEEALEIDDTFEGSDAGTAMATDGGGQAESPSPSNGPPGGGPSTTGDSDGMLVRILDSVRPVALRCDAFTDQEEVVVKPLKGPLSGIPGLSGTAILGDGNIVPILDVVSLET